MFGHLNGNKTLVFTGRQGPVREEWDAGVTCSETHVCAAVRLSHMQAIYPEEAGFVYKWHDDCRQPRPVDGMV